MDRPGICQVPEGSWEQRKWRKLIVKSSLVPKRPPRLREMWRWWGEDFKERILYFKPHLNPKMCLSGSTGGLEGTVDYVDCMHYLSDPSISFITARHGKKPNAEYFKDWQTSYWLQTDMSQCDLWQWSHGSYSRFYSIWIKLFLQLFKIVFWNGAQTCCELFTHTHIHTHNVYVHTLPS